MPNLMHHTRCTLLQLEARLPSRWIVGRQRIARLTLRNDSVVDLTGVLLAVEWSALGTAESVATEPITLPRNSLRNIDLPLKPTLQDEHSLRLSLQCDLGGFLQQTIVTDALHLKVSPVPHTPAELKIIVGDTVIGEKAFFGQMQTDQATTNFGHTIIVKPEELDRTLEHWLHDDPAMQESRALELFIASAECRDWENHHDIPLVGIAPGAFAMGRSPDDAEARDDERLRKDVQLPHGFWMSRTPITQAQYLRVMPALPPMKYESFRKPSHPVVNVSWHDAVAFCEALTCAEHATRSLPPGYVYRLPTEAEWEYACRAGNPTPTPRYGELREIGATLASGGVFGPVGRYQPNAWGLHDMLGLVFEWCADVYGPYEPFRLVAPVRQRPDGAVPVEQAEHVLRGGCYQGPDDYARASARASKLPGEASSRIGFRVVLARTDT
jgi:formylglycine-generating enzyme required for sulfatase activity